MKHTKNDIQNALQHRPRHPPDRSRLTVSHRRTQALRVQQERPAAEPKKILSSPPKSPPRPRHFIETSRLIHAAHAQHPKNSYQVYRCFAVSASRCCERIKTKARRPPVLHKQTQALSPMLLIAPLRCVQFSSSPSPATSPSLSLSLTHKAETCNHASRRELYLLHVVRAEADQPLLLRVHPRVSRKNGTLLVDSFPEHGLPEGVQALRVHPVRQPEGESRVTDTGVPYE